MLWRRWLGGRKGMPVKNWAVGCWSKLQTCIWPSWCHCHSLSLASVKSRLVLPFSYRLTQVVPKKGQLNGCVCVCVVLYCIVFHLACLCVTVSCCQCSWLPRNGTLCVVCDDKSYLLVCLVQLVEWKAMLLMMWLVLPGAGTTEGWNCSANWSCFARKKAATGTACKISVLYGICIIWFLNCRINFASCHVLECFAAQISNVTMIQSSSAFFVTHSLPFSTIFHIPVIFWNLLLLWSILCCCYIIER